MEDDHVDRPGVQARRRVEPTGTNRPIDLISPVIRVRLQTERSPKYMLAEHTTPHTNELRLAGLVARAVCPEPDPISNSAVKRLSADGTVSQDPGE